MKIYFGSDHRGYEHKEELKLFLKKQGYDVIDMGNTKNDPNDDYPDFIVPVAKAVAEDLNSRGIVFGMSGQGEAIVANRYKKVRAVVYYGGPKNIIQLSREHNNANILSIGAGFISIEETKEVALLWLKTDFSGEERHQRRIDKIEEAK